MSVAETRPKIDELMKKAADSLARSALVEAENMAVKALAMARQDGDFALMASVVPLLRDIRSKRFKQALTTSSGGKSRINVVKAPITEDMKITRGCHLVQPPQVGADSRRLRLAAFEAGVSVAVLCREPMTTTGHVPVVAISSGATIRVKIDPPANPDKPDQAWFADAFRQLGDWAIESLDVTLPPVRKMEALLERLDAIPEHEGLHDALQAACEEAHAARTQEKAVAAERAAARAAAKTKAGTATD
jgi:hypothetical protein